MTPQQEEHLLQTIRNDSSAFGKVYDEFYPRIFKYVFRRTGDYDLTSDITAETFLKAFINIKKFEWRGISLSAWLYRIATNETSYYFRKKKYRPELLSNIKDFNALELYTGVNDEREALERELSDLEAFNTIRLHLLELDVKYQEVIALRYFEDKDNSAISEILGKPEGTVKSLLSRGLEKLRQSIIKSATGPQTQHYGYETR